MASKRLVSIACGFYNNGEFAEETVGCLKAQDYDNIEIILVDDGSTDDTLETLRRFEGDGVTVIAQENQGIGAALHTAFAVAHGEFFAYHEAGDFSFPTRISRQIEAFDRDPPIGAVASHVEVQDVDGTVLRIGKPEIGDRLAERLLKQSQFSHSEMAYRRSWYERAGGYRAFFRYSEDNDLFLRLSEICAFAVVPEILVVKRHRAGSVTCDPRKTWLARCYRDFAEFCARERRAGRGDPLEFHGKAAAFLRPRSARLADRLARQAWKLIRNGELDIGREIAAHAYREKMTKRSIAALALSAMPRFIRTIGRSGPDPKVGRPLAR